MFDFKELEKIYLSTGLEDRKQFTAKLESIAEFIDKEKCFSEGIEFFTLVNKKIAKNPHCFRYIGNIYRLEGEYEKSLQHFQQAAAMSKGTVLYFEILYNLGMLHREHNALIKAKACFEEILDAYPQSAMVHNSLSCLLIYRGNFEEGWKKHYWRVQLDAQMQRLKEYFQLPEWENKTESHILILPEQGIGDKIMFSAFFSSLPKNKEYTAVVSTRLVAIFQRSFPTMNIVEGTSENIGKLKKQHFDAYCFMGCLPRILSSPTPSNLDFLKSTPYLYKRNANNKQTKKRRIGISWRGGTGVESEKRSINLELWLPILKNPEVDFINLQYDAKQSETELLRSFDINIFSDETINPLEDMDAFASLTSSCDIVITVDNSTAHLAGAMGIPTWVLLPNVSNWRWGKSGDKCYWYQSVRLFRQNDIRDWEYLMKHVAIRLEENVRKQVSGTIYT